MSPAERSEAGQAAPASLAAVVLDEEARRHAERDAPSRDYRDEDLIGVGGDDERVADALRQGGVGLLVALMAMAAIQYVEISAMGVIAPDVQESLGVSS